MIDKRLHVLRVMASVGTVTGAAAALHYTPSAVSAQLRSLADDLGVALLEPDGRRLKPTPAGRALIARLDELFALDEAVRADILSAADDVSEELRMCGFSTAAAALLPGVVKVLSEAHPRANVWIIEADPKECFEMLAGREVDLAVVIATPNSPTQRDSRFEQRPLLQDPLDLLVPSTHRLAEQRSVRLEQLATESWIADREGSSYHQLLLTACAAAGFNPDIAHRAAEWDSAVALVDAGLGCALVPRLARLPADYDVVRVPLRGTSQPHRNILTVVRRGSSRSPLIAEALAALEATARAQSESAPGEAPQDPEVRTANARTVRPPSPGSAR